MPRRTLDGRFRNNNRSAPIPGSILIARWVEAEVLALRLAGAKFAFVAQHITAVARGKQAPITPLLLQIVFPDDYTITIAGCAKAVSRALRREPKLGADQLAQLLMHRSEELYFSLQAAARSGDVKAILAAVRLLEFQASLGDAKGQLIAPPVSEP